jgi:hypothetical protein
MMRRPHVVFGFLLLILTFLGCGGGGSPVPDGLRYRTNWALVGAPGTPTGQSQKVTIFDSAGLSVSTVVLDNNSGEIDEIPFTLPNGSYVIQAQLMSGTNGSGVVTGVFQRVITLSGGLGVDTHVGKNPSSIVVSPNNPVVRVGRGQLFYTEGAAPDGTATFLVPDSISWTSLGAIGNITTSGSFTATAVGSGSVRATYTVNGAVGSAAVTTTSSNATRSKWTVLVYMNAANDLQQFSPLNMNQMERVAQSSDVRFVVQWKQATISAISPNPTFEGTRRFLIKPDTTAQINSELLQNMGTSVDMGQPSTLLDFIQWGKANFPADRYCLIVWNHGNGWRRSRNDITRAVSYDDQTGSSIQIWELNQALGSERFDILAWDASLMQMLEVAYEVKDNASYVVGSEESPPGEGYPYDLVFDNFRDNPDQTTRNLSKAFVDGMLEVPAYASRKITQSVVDTSRLPALATALGTLGVELTANASTLTNEIQQTRSAAQSFSPTSVRVFRDLLSVCNNLESRTTIPGVRSAITGVRTAHTNAVIWEGHNSNSSGSNGLSIDFSSGTTIASTLSDYRRMKLSQDTQWDEFLAIAP